MHVCKKGSCQEGEKGKDLAEKGTVQRAASHTSCLCMRGKWRWGQKPSHSLSELEESEVVPGTVPLMLPLAKMWPREGGSLFTLQSGHRLVSGLPPDHVEKPGEEEGPRVCAGGDGPEEGNVPHQSQRLTWCQRQGKVPETFPGKERAVRLVVN